MKVKTTKITTANLTTVPAAIRTALKVKAGDRVEWHVQHAFFEHQDEIGEECVIVRKAEAKK